MYNFRDVFLRVIANGWGCEKCWDWDSVRIPRDEVSKKPICFLIGGKPAFFTPLVSVSCLIRRGLVKS